MIAQCSRPRHIVLASLLLLASSPKSLMGATVNESPSSSTSEESTNNVESVLPPSRSSRAKKRLRPESKEPLQVQVRLPTTTNTNSPSALSEQALHLSGDSAFARQLQEEEIIVRRHEQLQHESSSSSANTSWYQSSHVANAGVAILALGSLYFHQGSTLAIQEILSTWVSAMAIAWLPTLILQGTFAELVAVASLFLQPSIRQFILDEFVPNMKSTFSKMILAEAWKRLWGILPMPELLVLLPPRRQREAYIVKIPPWMQQGLEQFHQVADKFTQSLIRKTIQQSVRGTVGVFYESVTHSLLEVSILYDEDSSSSVNVDDLVLSDQTTATTTTTTLDLVVQTNEDELSLVDESET